MLSNQQINKVISLKIVASFFPATLL